MTSTEFVEGLVGMAAETRALVDEHLKDHYGEVLLHLLIGDLRRFLLAAFKQGDERVLQRCLDHLDLALRDGDSEVENAVAVSFVEATGWWDPSMRAFIDTWPPALRAEADRQEAGRSDGTEANEWENRW
ncbi:MAG: hypothetical protein M3450_20120 [Actinomycetota bacterium]|nr:hypothetical protein [Actinomycetota bacterium]